ncbi:MAG TPA: glycerophosphodiester phosphodiesterase family protein [Nitrospiria bacterium]|nr:glycerophosphodiester phosphodiesterase family protein [Nitrospiria bacterium]
MTKEEKAPKDFLNIAHRGASAHAPENTLAAFRLGKEMGAGMIEFDVWETKDHHLVVFHDASLHRTTGLRRRVESLTLAEVRELDAGAWFHPSFEGERIPTLTEVLTALSGIDFNIEIKKADPKRVLAEVARGRARRRVIFSSFDLALLRRLHKIDPSARLGRLIDREPWRRIWRETERLRFFSINLPLRRVSAAAVRKAHEKGLKVLVYTVNRKADMRRMIRLGVDGLFTNYPDRLDNLLHSLSGVRD